MNNLLALSCYCAIGIAYAFTGQTFSDQNLNTRQLKLPVLQAFDDGSPSDYDTADLRGERSVAVDDNEEDVLIRDALKRELLLFSSVTNRGEYASSDEQNIIIDLVAQLEALNPTANPASTCEGEWDLCLSSTQFFRSSPFFQSIRVAVGEDNKQVAENFFDIHDRATTASRIGRVRQSITEDQLTSEVELEVGLVPGLPIRVTGNVVTAASLKVVSPETFELQMESTQVKGSNIPFLNQFLDDPSLDIPFSNIYNTIQGQVPVIPMKTFYVDEGMRITRDVDENFFVFTRA